MLFLSGLRRTMPDGRALPTAGLLNNGYAAHAFRLGRLAPPPCSWCGHRLAIIDRHHDGPGTPPDLLRCPQCDPA